jgi:hypothetical protein
MSSQDTNDLQENNALYEVMKHLTPIVLEWEPKENGIDENSCVPRVCSCSEL